MAARVCSECGGLVASSLTVCPHCGHIIESSQGASSYNASGYGTAGSNNSAGYGAQRPNFQRVNPYTNIIWTVVAFFIFWPFAVVSLIYYFKSDQEWGCGNESGASHFGELSVKWGKASLWMLLVPIVFIFFALLITLSWV